MVRFMVWTDLGAMLGAVTKHVDVLLLGWVAGAAEVGLYRLARSIASLPGYLVGPLQAAVYPRLASQWAESGWNATRTALRRHARFAAGLAAAGVVGIVALPLVVRGLAGDRYGAAAGTAQVLLVGTLVWVRWRPSSLRLLCGAQRGSPLCNSSLQSGATA
jgi:O-antigen/teichoic acid export membrane protein